jgi:hypothetical protein
MTSVDNLVHFVKSACLPAKVYLGIFAFNAIAGLFFISKKKLGLMNLAVVLVILALIGLAVFWFGNYLCANGFEVITWILVVLPLVNFFNTVKKLV